ncbi:MAG: hypothetical protein ACPF9V_07165 [Candidatus Puniceispirillaceae bacterium]
MDRLEILIDNLLIYLPADIPFLANLIEQPEGRYIVFGLAVVIALLAVWTLLAVLQMIFFGQRSQPVTNKTPPIELSETVDTDKVADGEAKTEDGFSFFKKPFDADIEETGESPALVAIEQEMLAVRRLYTGGHVIKDVYVSETRRLYAEAQAVKSSQPE